MLSINMNDVISVVNQIKPQLIAIVVAIVLAIVICIAVMKLPKALKKLIRGEALIAMILAILVAVNSICNGPMSTMLDLVTGNGSLSEETSEKATELVKEIADEGIVLLKDEESILPVAGGKLNVFGWASTNPCYGGTGSGALNTSYPTVTLLQGLNEAGIETNTELSDFYTNYKADRPEVGMWAQDWTLPEPNVSQYSDELIANAKAFSDTAMVVITRVGGEGADLPTDMQGVVDGTYKIDTPMTYDDTLNEGNDWDAGDTFLEMSNREEDMLKLVCDNFDNVIVVYNGANPFELGFVNDYPQIKGAIWCAGTGQAGFASFGKIVSGEVNPSGKTIDTFVYDLTAAPTFNNMGLNPYTNMDEFSSTSFTGDVTTPSFVNYVEGIYVGYKYYETAAAEGAIDYDKTVQYPFGYGLSYTTFEQKLDSVKEADGQITVTATVTNTGDKAGKDVVEVYYNPPYTNGGIEKSSANLINFAKTAVLEPGASETVEVTFSVEDMASFDQKDAKAYVLEEGDYVISINADSHNVIDSDTYKVSKTVVYDENNKRESDQVAATNQFDYAAGDVTYLSRADKFANYKEATAAPTSFELAEESKSTFYNVSNYLTAEVTASEEDADAAPVTTGASNGLKLVDLRGVDYNDAKWDELLDQLTIQEMTDLIALGGYQTLGIESIGKNRTNDCDGPASINNNFTGVGSVGFPAGVLVAATWNKDLAHAFGDSIGSMADEMDTTGWYAPAMNIHRTAFAGRNFEYYSEDGVLSGYIAAEAIKGCQDHGVYAYMKHFALNDQETNRCGMLMTWTNEQAMREIYLKPFERCVKEADCHAVMSSFNYIGNRWAGGTTQLLNTVLREEWGFVGMVLTDYFGVYGYMSADQAIRNGNDFCLVNYPTETSAVRFNETNGAQQAMRTASKNILYTVVNSRAYSDENLNQPAPIWHGILTGVNVAFAVLLLALEALLIKKYLKRKKEEA